MFHKSLRTGFKQNRPEISCQKKLLPPKEWKMGDRGGKKDKEKNKKQMAQKHDQKVKTAPVAAAAQEKPPKKVGK